MDYFVVVPTLRQVNGSKVVHFIGKILPKKTKEEAKWIALLLFYSPLTLTLPQVNGSSFGNFIARNTPKKNKWIPCYCIVRSNPQILLTQC